MTVPQHSRRPATAGWIFTLVMGLILSATSAIASPAAAETEWNRSMSGHVTLPAGVDPQELSLVTVKVWYRFGPDRPADFYSTVAANGSWSLSNLPAEPLQVTFDVSQDPSTDYRARSIGQGLGGKSLFAFEADTVDLTQGSVTGVDATLQLGRSVIGHVSMPPGSPADWTSKAEVWVRPTDPTLGLWMTDELTRTVRLDAEGNFRVDGLLATSYDITITPDHERFDDTTSYALAATRETRTVDLSTASETTRLDVTLSPLPAADITVSAAEAGTLSVLNRDDGSCIESCGSMHLEPGTTRLRMKQDEPFVLLFETDQGQQFLKTRDGTDSWTPWTEPGTVTVTAHALDASIGGSITTELMRGIAASPQSDVGGGTIELHEWVGGQWRDLWIPNRPRLYDNRTQRYSFDHVAPGQYEICVRLYGFACNTAGAKPTSNPVVTVGPGEQRTGVDFTARATEDLDEFGFDDISARSSSPFFSQFAAEIYWMFSNGFSTGTLNPDGSRLYKPRDEVTREAMAAFMYRLAGKPYVTEPATSPFTDVSANSPFYSAILWMDSRKITTGWTMKDGTRQFRPKLSISREATAAFFHRAYLYPSPWLPAVTYADTGDSPFADDIEWLTQTGIATGSIAKDGSRRFNPKAPIRRDAMAAFFYRLKRLAKPIGQAQ